MKTYVRPSLEAKCCAEFIGSFFLMCSLGLCVHTESIGGAISVGATLTVMVYALGSVSGGHFNPAVTLAIWLAGRRKIRAWEGMFYVVSQILGTVCGTLFTVAAAVPQHGHTSGGMGGSLRFPGPGTGYAHDHAIVVEVIYSTLLCYVVLNVATTESKTWGSAPNANFGFAIGMTVTGAAIAICPISGCSMNPALSLGSALAAHLSQEDLFGGPSFFWMWPYMVAPLLGSFLGAMAFWIVRGGVYSRLEYEDFALDRAMERQRRIEEETERPPPVLLPTEERDTVSIFLDRDRPIVLPADVVNHELACTLKWALDMHRSGQPSAVDIDLTCVKFGQSGDCLGAVYFAKKVDQGIKHSGDGVTGTMTSKDAKEGAEAESVFLTLSKVKQNIHALVFVVMIYSGECFDDVSKYCLSLADLDDGHREFGRYQKRNTNDSSNAQIAAMLYRNGNDWCFKAVDECHTVPVNSSYRKLMTPMQAQVARAVQPTSSGAASSNKPEERSRSRSQSSNH
jgi:aquaporin Z